MKPLPETGKKVFAYKIASLSLGSFSRMDF